MAITFNFTLFHTCRANMAGISKLTAFIIATRDDIVVSAGFYKPLNKWVGWITLGLEDRYRPLLDSGPFYDTEEAALEGMRKTIAEVKEAVEKEVGAKNPTGQEILAHVFAKTDERVFVQPEEKHEN